MHTRLMAVAVCLSAWLSPLRAGEGGPKPTTAGSPRTIAAVKTWDGLPRQPAVELGDGVTARLGLEADRCRPGGGLFLYCLTDRYAPPSSWSESDRLGPFCVALSKTSGDPVDWAEYAFGLTARQRHPAGLSRCTLLFMRRVIVTAAGPLHVRVLARPNGHGDDPTRLPTVAVAEIEGTRDADHPWLALEEMRPERKPGQVEFDVTNNTGVAALPLWPEFCPIVFRGTAGEKEVALPKDGALPTLIPAAPCRLLKLR